MFAMIQAVASDRLTLRDILLGIPHDGAAFFVYTLLLVSAGFIWYGNSRSKPR